MGYTTTYCLDIMNNNTSKSIEQIQDDVYKIFEELDVNDYALDKDWETIDSVKWYEHEEHMRIVSSRITDIVFILRGEGEENGDLWIKYFKNGKMQRCSAIITYDSYNENSMK